MPTKAMSCNNCAYMYVSDVQQDLTRQLFCRRYPPTPLVVANGHQAQILNVFPAVQTNQVCGEHAPWSGEDIAAD